MRRVASVGVLALALGLPLSATDTERLYLSGTGPHDAVEWEFSIDGGRRAGEWTTIPVPSQWELEGFGEFAYGMDDDVRAEVGSYRTRFLVPGSWQGRRIDLVFEGAMTDVEASLNGVSVGKRHRGGFTRFSFDVTGLVNIGEAGNLLEVEVSEASENRSVNAAERDADYWVFGGIYRPVYLESRPARGIAHIAIDARHDGFIRVEIEVDHDSEALDLVARVVGDAGEPIGTLSRERDLRRGESRVLDGSLSSVVPWSSENPALYSLELELRRGARVLHRTRRRFGFRTVEVRPGEGLFVNGKRTLLKGINRHSFWPTGGRALTPEQNRRDVELIKELNANAVRASHYPPDVAFLEACDELGLYVIDELPGWHDAYASGVGRQLIAEMVRRDVNHPSVIMWANGNEGGWNSSLDGEYAKHDPQQRPVLHPQDVFGGFDTFHYPTWEQLRAMVAGEGLANWLRGWFGPLPLVMPTEMLHGLYDGGHGAGLAEFWSLIRQSPRGAGGFLWAFLDESVIRDDRGGELDSFTNYAPDGIVGPYRDKEPSFATVRKIWSPVVPTAWVHDQYSVSVDLLNDFAETDLSVVRFRWRWLRWPGPEDGTGVAVVGSGEVAGPAIEPGGSGELTIERVSGADALELTAFGPGGAEIEKWVVQTSTTSLLARWLADAQAEEGAVVDGASAVALLGLNAEGGQSRPADEGWSLYPSGWLRVEAGLAGGPLVLPGAARGESEVEWLGRGPTPVWRNRLEGPELGLWEGPVDPGFYDGVLWARVRDSRGDLIVVLETPGFYLGFSAPRFADDARHARVQAPPVDSLSLSWSIPMMGSKFHPGEALGSPREEVRRSRARKAVIWLRRTELER